MSITEASKPEQLQRVPVNILPDCEATTLATWLKKHEGVEIISRDSGELMRRVPDRGRHRPDRLLIVGI